MKLAGKVALVTGAAKGIGRAIVLALAKEGASVVVADIDLESARLVTQEVKHLGREAQAVRVDVAQPKEVEQMVTEALSVFGRIDILVNNAGIIRRGTFLDHSREDWELVLRVNLGGTFNCAKAIVPHMIKQGSGKIINISSVAGDRGVPLAGNVGYCGSKAAVSNITRMLAYEWAKHGINVNAIGPSVIFTPMMKNALPPEVLAGATALHPIGRVAEPEELIGTCVYLASAASDYMTGQIVYVDGGRSCFA